MHAMDYELEKIFTSYYLHVSASDKWLDCGKIDKNQSHD